jgi:hypothetical protein
VKVNEGMEKRVEGRASYVEEDDKLTPSVNNPLIEDFPVLVTSDFKAEVPA